MARRRDNECAFCAEEVDPDHALIGRDWKVYCCSGCAEKGELISQGEQRQLLQRMIPSRDYTPPEIDLLKGG